MATLECPKCGSKDIVFGQDHITHLYWYQDPEGIDKTVWSNFEQERESYAEHEAAPVVATCLDCATTWNPPGSVRDYLDEV